MELLGTFEEPSWNVLERVECVIGHEWRDGVVVATNFTPPAESGAPEGWVAPYQVKLPSHFRQTSLDTS